MILGIALTIISVLIGFTIFLLIRNNKFIYKLQITSALNTLIIIWISIYCYYINKPEYIDTAILYAILSFISILAFKKYVQLNQNNCKEV